MQTNHAHHIVGLFSSQMIILYNVGLKSDVNFKNFHVFGNGVFISVLSLFIAHLKLLKVEFKFDNGDSGCGDEL